MSHVMVEQTEPHFWLGTPWEQGMLSVGRALMLLGRSPCWGGSERPSFPSPLWQTCLCPGTQPTHRAPVKGSLSPCHHSQTPCHKGHEALLRLGWTNLRDCSQIAVSLTDSRHSGSRSPCCGSDPCRMTLPRKTHCNSGPQGNPLWNWHAPAGQPSYRGGPPQSGERFHGVPSLQPHLALLQHLAAVATLGMHTTSACPCVLQTVGSMTRVATAIPGMIRPVHPGDSGASF